MYCSITYAIGINTFHYPGFYKRYLNLSIVISITGDLYGRLYKRIVRGSKEQR